MIPFEKETAILDLIRPVLDFLENRLDVTDVNVITSDGSNLFKTWEQTNKCLLPTDLKNFYQLTDGFTLTWNFNANDSAKLPLGKLSVNPISKLKRLFPSSFQKVPNSFKTSELYLHQDFNSSKDTDVQFDERHMMFELDSCNGSGKVVLVVRKPDLKNNFHTSELYSCICFLDRSLTIHRLSDSFTAYFNLLLAHLGLPEWQYVFTDIGLSPQAKFWIRMFCPGRLEIDENLPNNEKPNKDMMTSFDGKKIFKEDVDFKTKSESNPSMRLTRKNI